MSMTERLEALAYRIGCEVRERANEHHPGLAKAWISFSCTADNHVIIQAGYNVKQVQRLGVGHYRIFFATPLPHTHYCWNAQARNSANGCLRRRIITAGPADPKMAESLDLRCTTFWGHRADAPEINLVVFH